MNIDTSTPAIFDGNCGPISGSTVFHYYDNDVLFQTDGPYIVNYVCRKLGYPIISVELQSGSIFNAFEESIMKYSEEINKVNITNNIYNSIGAPTGSSFTGKLLNNNVDRVIRMSEEYGAINGTGGSIDIKRGYVDLVDGQQVYDLQTLWSNVSESGNRLEIRKVYHYEPSAISRYYDPTVGTGVGVSNMLGEFGFERNSSPAVTFLVQPVYGDLLKLQQIEFNSLIRKSGYSFEIRNNKVAIFPIPSILTPIKVFFEYTVVSDQANPLAGWYSGSENSGKITDASNMPYDLIPYISINSVGKQWIREYTVALSKEVLGLIRGKYETIPYPKSELRLDGATLRSEAAVEKENLLKQLTDFLLPTKKEEQMKIQAESVRSLNEQLQQMPLSLYIG